MADSSVLARALAENTRRLREQRDLSQDRLVERCAALGKPLSKRTIINVEAATGEVRLDTLEALASAFGVHPAELLLPAVPAPTGGVTLEEFAASELAAGMSPDELAELQRDARLPWGHPTTMRAWLKAWEYVRARREGSQP